jgi:hypothetical protein
VEGWRAVSWYVVAFTIDALLLQDVVPVGRNCTMYDSTTSPVDGDCHDTVIVVVVIPELDRLLGWPGAAVAEATVDIAANAIVPPE